MLDTNGIIKVTRLTQARHFDAARNLLYHNPARFIGLCESSQPHSAVERAFCVSSEDEMTIPHKSGIYQIVCIPTGKIYVGSAIDFYVRQYGHWNELRRGVHYNVILQRAWNKYSEAAFRFEVLEFAPAEQLIEREQWWIDHTKCTDRKIGFNILTKAYSALGLKMPPDVVERQRLRASKTWEGFVDPDGHPVPSITNLRAFCKKQGLSQSAMQRLAKGFPDFQSHKGWTHQDSPPRRPKPIPPRVDNTIVWEGFIDPDGSPVGPITHLEQFCHERGLEPTNMRSLARGRRSFHRGWSHVNAKPKTSGAELWSGFVDPEGQPVEIFNLAQFCREHGLTVTCMRMLMTGRLKNHRGWTYRKENDL
jgi:group I intron endonuclease